MGKFSEEALVMVAGREFARHLVELRHSVTEALRGSSDNWAECLALLHANVVGVCGQMVRGRATRSFRAMLRLWRCLLTVMPLMSILICGIGRLMWLVRWWRHRRC